MAPATEAGVFELFWIGVDPDVQRSGVGTELIADFESVARSGGARILTVSTSSLAATEKARRFYAARGYTRAAEDVPDYYGEGDNKVTFTKVLPVT